MTGEIKRIKGTGIPLRGDDIDTDRIIPARFMKCVTFEGLGEYVFYDERFDGEKNKKDHPFNDDEYRNGSVLIVNKNFGCGSSREHAPQALFHSGITAVVGESFAEIFRGNCIAMGIPAITLDKDDITGLQGLVERNPDIIMDLDLEKKRLAAGTELFEFDIPEPYRRTLMTGKWDSTASLLDNKTLIERKAAELPYMNGFR